MTITSDRLIEGVNRRISNPQSQGLLQDGDILAFADDVIRGEIIPLMESAQVDYFVERTSIPLVGGQSLYSIPYRSIARGLREIKLSDNSEQFVRNLPLIDIANAYLYYQWATIVGFYFEGDRIRLVPEVPDPLATDQKLLIWYRLPPNNLVPESEVSQVISIAGDVVTVSNIPDQMVATSRVDFIQAQSGSSIYAMDVEVQAVGAGTLTFASGEVPSQLQSGDYICLRGESYVVNFLPNESLPLLETLVCMRALTSISDYEGVKMIASVADQEKANLLKIMEPRIDGEGKIIVNYNSLARGYKMNNRAWLYGQ